MCKVLGIDGVINEYIVFVSDFIIKCFCKFYNVIMMLGIVFFMWK